MIPDPLALGNDCDNFGDRGFVHQTLGDVGLHNAVSVSGSRALRWIAIAFLSLFSLTAYASQPENGALGFQPPVTPIAERVDNFHNILLVIITLITLLVLGLLVYVIVRYNAKKNPVPSKFSHNTTIEVVWTLGPVLVLLFISFFSFRELYFQDVFPNVPEDQVVTVKAQGNQWNWTYTYPDVSDPDGFPLEFVSNPLHRGLSTDPVGTPDAPRNLAVDYPMVVPVNTVVRVQTAASDVIHSWTVPAFGVKTDAIPGKLNELWFKVNEGKEGVYYGQCSELCGKDHAFMPIEVRVVSREQYDAWIERAATDIDDANAYIASIFDADAPIQLASAQ